MICRTHSFFTKTAKKIRKLISTKYLQWNSLQTCVMITKLRYLYLWIFFFHFMPNSFSKSFKIYCIITFTHGILDLHFIRWNIWWIKLSSMTYLLFHSYNELFYEKDNEMALKMFIQLFLCHLLPHQITTKHDGKEQLLCSVLLVILYFSRPE